LRALAIHRDGGRAWFGDSETEFDRSGLQKRRWVHVPALGRNLARIEVAERRGNKPAPDPISIEIQYADGFRNLMLALDASGAPVASFLYGAFGEVVHEDGAELHRRQFNGVENDAVSGLRYYGFRYYDPLSLRWTASDPLYRVVPEMGLTEPQRMNLYSFSLNNPLAYLDPDGRDSTTPQPEVQSVEQYRREGANGSSIEFRRATVEDDQVSTSSVTIAQLNGTKGKAIQFQVNVGQLEVKTGTTELSATGKAIEAKAGITLCALGKCVEASAGKDVKIDGLEIKAPSLTGLISDKAGVDLDAKIRDSTKDDPTFWESAAGVFDTYKAFAYQPLYTGEFLYDLSPWSSKQKQ